MQVKTSKRTNQMLLLCPVRLNSHLFMWSPSKYAEPPQLHQSTACSLWEFRKRHIEVPDTMLQYWMLIAGFGYLWCMGGSRKFCLGGWVSWKLYFSFFHRGQCGPGLLFKAFGPKGSYFFSRLSITVFLRKHITTCDLPGGMQTRCPPPPGHAHVMLS